MRLGIFGTKMRSVIDLASREGIAAIVAQQFEVAARIAGHGLVPIIEPEVSIKSPDKAGAEAILRDELARALDALPEGRRVMLKLHHPGRPGLLRGAGAAPARGPGRGAVGRLHAGGGVRAAGPHHGVVASFSRALVEDLRRSMSDDEFDAALGRSIDEIYRASTVKV